MMNMMVTAIKNQNRVMLMEIDETDSFLYLDDIHGDIEVIRTGRSAVTTKIGVGRLSESSIVKYEVQPINKQDGTWKRFVVSAELARIYKGK